ncbi:MAG: M56 family metallopeptidase [Lachnospiraceae bacterium]|nr:M56 family metallopeptidase [Lachnospiraceae bacterium]
MVFVQMTVSGAVLILLIVLLRGIALKRLPKSIFPVLWGIALSRLLLPVVIPSAYSIYSLPVWKQAAAGLQSSYEAMQNPVDEENRERAGGPENIEEQKRTGKTENIDERKDTDIRRRGQTEPENIRTEQNSREQPERFGMEPWRMETLLPVWCAGMSACLLFFVTTYLRALFLFRTSLPVRKAGVERWLLEHKKRRRISVRQSDRVMTPLTYGIFRPVILLPKQTDWQNEEGLAYILLHEYVHICRMDTVTKLLAVSALCVHWFNPFVWVMYVLLNRDLELSCDEKVVRLSGGTQKAAYARVLIDMAARQSGLMPLGSHFGQNVVEERIDAIMKWKKNSFCKKIVSGAVFVGLAVVFTASILTTKVNAKDDKKIPSGTGFTEEEKTRNTAGEQGYAAQEDYDSLFLLRTADYQRMTVADFNRMLLDWANENFDAYERIREDCYRKERQAVLSEEELFFTDTTMTLSAEENYRMVQHLKTGKPEEDPGYISYRLQKTIADGLVWCGFEYAFTYHIFNKNELTVAERDAQVGGVIRDIENLWESTDVEAFLQMTREDVLKKLEEIAAKYSDGRIEITIDKERVYFEEMDERQFT